MELRVGSLVLRQFDQRDEVALVAGLNDPDIARFMTVIPQPYTSKHAAEWVERCRQAWAEDTSHPFAITNGKSGELVGSIEVLSKNGSIGYWVAADARGRGVATQALKLVCEAHSHLRLWLFTHPQNLASQRVAEKAGFRRAGIVPVEIPFRDGTAEAIRFERD